jgi:hypothetical protein
MCGHEHPWSVYNGHVILPNDNPCCNNWSSTRRSSFVKDDKGKVSHLVLHMVGRDTKATRLEPEPAQPE